MSSGLPWLVTGSSGQVGGALVRLAGARGIAVAAPLRAQLDLASAKSVTDFLATGHWSAIINCGAYTAVDRAENDEATAHEVNAAAPAALAHHAERHGIPLYHVSTDYVFEGTKAEPYVETDPVAPLGAYGRTKAAGEAAIRAACPDGHAIVRTAWVLSAGGANFLNTMLRLCAERPEVSVVADQIGCPTAADDLAQILADMVLADAATGETYHAVNAGATTWHGLADHIFAAVRRRGRQAPVLNAITTADYPTPARRPANSRLHCAKLSQKLGLSLRPWQEAVDAILAQRLDTGANG